MPSSKRPKSSDTTSNSENPSKKFCTRDQVQDPDPDRDWIEASLAAIVAEKERKETPMNELQRMKQRIEEAEKELARLHERRVQTLLRDPAAEIFELARDLYKGNYGDGKGRMVGMGMYPGMFRGV